MNKKEVLENCKQEAMLELNEKEQADMLKVFDQLDDFFSYLDKSLKTIKDVSKIIPADYPVDLIIKDDPKNDKNIDKEWALSPKLDKSSYLKNHKTVVEKDGQSFFTINKVVNNDDN